MTLISNGSIYIFDHSNQWRFTKFLFHNFGATKTKCLPCFLFKRFSPWKALLLSHLRENQWFQVYLGLRDDDEIIEHGQLRIVIMKFFVIIFLCVISTCPSLVSESWSFFAILLDFQWVIRYSKWQVHLRFAKNYVIYANN